MRIPLLLCFALGALQTTTAQKNEDADIKASINQMFAAMKNADTVLLAGSFAPQAILQTVLQNKEGTVEVRTEKVAAFISSIGKPHTESYDERIEFGSIKVDGNLAAVWTPYKFYVGNKFLHCGVNSFQLVKINGSWKIQYVIDTRRKTGCD